MNYNRLMGKKCSIQGCGNKSFCRTWCMKHHSRWVATGDPLKTPTGRQHGVRSICSIKNCKGLVEGNGFCHKHYTRFRKYGDPLFSKRSITYGQMKYTKDGYTLVYKPDWPSVRKDGYLLEHRYVIEKKLRRTLLKTEIVHHKNGKRDDNRLVNLQVMIITKHFKGHPPLKCKKCGELCGH